MSSGISDKSFTQQWLQSLTLAAGLPTAPRIKPLLETINELTRQHSDSDRMASARQLWDFASSEGLLSLLELMPIKQPNWVFDRDDNFAYTRRDASSAGSKNAESPGETALDFDSWAGWLGIQPCVVPMLAEVNSRDWQSMLRQEAVRLQQVLNTAAVPSGLTLNLKCQAEWDLKHWLIRFDDAQWMVIKYEDAFSVERPEFSELEDRLMWVIAQGQETMLKSAPKSPTEVGAGPWINCVPQLKDLHQQILVTDSKKYATWFRRVWASVWIVIYREQNVLRGQANIDVVRQEMAACLKEVPRLTLWMFVLAKLVCECQLGRGLGTSADYLA